MQKKLGLFDDVRQPCSSNIAVNFQHWQCLLDDEVLTRLGSPHFDDSRARLELADYTEDKATRCFSERGLEFLRAQIVAANEAFPEAAVSDPLADLELWQEWNRGTRAFPYPGYYHRLGITGQDNKTNSPSSVGVLGEIMAGLFAQVGISPWIVVRVIRRWPDFILFTPRDERYSFVEAKAFTTSPDWRGALGDRVHCNLLGEVALQAVRQINADPFVKVWGAFTYIKSISPMVFDVTFLEFDCDDTRRRSRAERPLPQAVIEGLALRVLAYAATTVNGAVVEALRPRPGRRSSGRDDAERELSRRAVEMVYDALQDYVPRAEIERVESKLKAEISKQVCEINFPHEGDGRSFFSAREHAARGRLAQVRLLGTSQVLTRDITADERQKLQREASMENDWLRANQPFMDVDGRFVWRCGSALFFIREAGVGSNG